MKTPRGTSESSTTSDNTTEFIDIVKKYDVVYNTHNPDYKNVEVKMKVWSQIAEEIGLSVDASKRKWKNLRDSYTKYLRSFRIGTKTSKKYQYWAHADHMEFLKPYQGPGRSATATSSKPNEEEDTECDLGFQVLAKTTTASEDDLKITITNTPSTTINAASSLSSTEVTMSAITSSSMNYATSALPLTSATAASSLSTTTAAAAAATTCASTTVSNIIPSSSSTGTLMLPMPSLPTVQLPPQFIAGKPIAGNATTLSHVVPQSTFPTTMSTQIFSLPAALSGVNKNNALPSVPVSSSASSVGCLILEPHLFATSVDTFKKELAAPAFGLFHSIATQGGAPTATTTTAKINPPLITKIRRVPPSQQQQLQQQQQQTSAVNLSFTQVPPPPAAIVQPPAAKTRKTDYSSNRSELDVSAVLQANRDLDANTLFFLSLAKTVRSMPTKFQSLAKMRCMRIVSDIELELENFLECNGSLTDEGMINGNKYSNADSPSDGSCMTQSTTVNVNEAGTEHFVYVMSPSRVESMIDISSEEENTMNGI